MVSAWQPKLEHRGSLNDQAIQRKNENENKTNQGDLHYPFDAVSTSPSFLAASCRPTMMCRLLQEYRALRVYPSFFSEQNSGALQKYRAAIDGLRPTSPRRSARITPTREHPSLTCFHVLLVDRRVSTNALLLGRDYVGDYRWQCSRFCM